MQSDSDIEQATVNGHKALQSGNLEDAAHQFNVALERARQVNDKSVLRACHFNVGACHIAHGRPDEGLESLQFAVQLDDGTESASNTADLFYNIGLASFSLGHLQHARESYIKAAEFYRQTGNIELQAEIQTKLGECCQITGNRLKAIDHFSSAVNLWRKVEDDSATAVALNGLAKALAKDNQLERCGKTLKKLLDICNGLEDHVLLAQIFNDIGVIYSNENELESARDCFYEALSSVRYDETDGGYAKQLEGAILQNLGAAFNRSKQFDKAVEFHEKAIETYDKVEDRRSQGMASSNAAYAYYHLYCNAKAIEHFNNAIHFSIQSNDAKGQLLALEGLAAVHVSLKDYQKAIALYKDILGLTAKQSLKGDEYTDMVIVKLTDATYMKAEMDMQSRREIDDNDESHGRKRNARVQFKTEYHRSSRAEGHSYSHGNRNHTQSIDDRLLSNGQSTNGLNHDDQLNATTQSINSHYYERPVDEVQFIASDGQHRYRGSDYTGRRQQQSKTCVVQ